MKQIAVDVEVNRAIENGRMSFAETENDILKRLLRVTPQATKISEVPELASKSGATRTNGNWTVRVRGEAIAVPNLREAYRTVLLRLSDAHSDFLENLSKERSRSRRFVARRPEDLYANSSHLASAHAKPLKGGWFYDSNLSAEQVSQRVRTAARLCGLKYGSDVQVLRDLKEI
jgi:hypothetical protein